MRALRAILITTFLLGVALLTLMAIQVFDDQDVDNVAVSMRMPASLRRFDPKANAIERLPGPARRWLRHAITPGAHLAQTVQLRLNGRIRTPERPRPLTYAAIEMLSPRRGFVWRANAWDGRWGLRWVEHYFDGQARIRKALWGLWPRGTEESEDVVRSLRARLALESVWVPSQLLPDAFVRWVAIDTRRARAELRFGEIWHPIEIEVGAKGRLEAIETMRWQRSADGGWQEAPYRFVVDEEKRFEEYTIASRLHLDGDSPDGVFEIEVLEAHFVPVEQKTPSAADERNDAAGENNPTNAGGGESDNDNQSGEALRDASE